MPSTACTCSATGFASASTSGASRAHTSVGHSRRGVAGRATGSASISTWATRAKLWLSRVKKPQVSKPGARSSTPASAMRPWVGRRPYKPQWLAGARTLPPVSVPSAKSHSPLLTAEAEPDDEPPLMRSGAAPFIGAPKWALLPFIEKANSSVTVLPTIAAPASSRRCTVGAVVDLMPDIASRNGLPPPVG